MKLSAAEIATRLGGTVEGDGDILIYGLCRIEEGAPGLLTFLYNPKYESHLYTSAASAVIVANGYQPQQPTPHTFIRVPEPYVAFKTLLALFEPGPAARVGLEQPCHIGPGVTHGDGLYVGAFAYVGAGCTLGQNVKIYPNVTIGEGVTIGNDVVIYPNVTIYHGCKLGNGVTVHAGTVIGSDGFGYLPQPDGSFQKIPQVGFVEIGDNVEIGANTAIDRATVGATRIHNGVKIDNLVQVAHNVEIGRHTALASQSGVAGSARIGAHCLLAGQVGVLGHIEVADRTQVGAQSGISKSVKRPGQKLFGSPARALREELRGQAAARQLPDVLQRLAELERQLKALQAQLPPDA